MSDNDEKHDGIQTLPIGLGVGLGIAFGAASAPHLAMLALV